MKKLFVFVLSFVSILLQAQVYDFPVKPGTSEWGKLVTEEERFAAMQIPESVLESMSTHDLILTCMNYPAMGYFTAFDDPQDGMDLIIRNFNGLQELMRRSDTPQELVSVYKQMDQRKMALQKQNLNQSYWTIRRCYFELLLTQDDIVNKMSAEVRSELLKEASAKIEYKLGDQNEYSVMDYQPTLLILDKVGNSVNKAKSISMAALASADPVYSNYTIYTPNGTAVTARKLVSGDFTSSEKNDLKDYWLDYYNNRITFAGDATYEYNCHGYAWYSSEGHEHVWINTPGDDAFWNDGSYVLTTSTSDAE